MADPMTPEEKQMIADWLSLHTPVKLPAAYCADIEGGAFLSQNRNAAPVGRSGYMKMFYAQFKARHRRPRPSRIPCVSAPQACGPGRQRADQREGCFSGTVPA